MAGVRLATMEGIFGIFKVEFWNESVIALKRELVMSLTPAYALVSSYVETPVGFLLRYKELSEFDL